jgi:hypothetical protein
MASSALVKAREHLARMHNRIKGLSAKGEEAVGEGISAALVTGGAGAMGFADAKWGANDGTGNVVMVVQGVPVSLLVGLGGHAAAFMGIAGRHSKHVHDAASGALAAYGYNLGKSMAAKVA